MKGIVCTTIRSNELEFFKRFSDACRVELRRYSVYLESGCFVLLLKDEALLVLRQCK
jgi:hypothetical protein